MADEARVRKVQDRIQETVARLLSRRIKDPRLGFVTVTDVRVTGDLQHASIFYTVLGDEDDRRATARALESSKGLIRSEVGKALGIRLTPSLEFIPDALPETAASLEEALASARERDAKIAEASRGASFAGEADPYRRDEDEDDASPDDTARDGHDGTAAQADEDPAAPAGGTGAPATGDIH